MTCSSSVGAVGGRIAVTVVAAGLLASACGSSSTSAGSTPDHPTTTKAHSSKPTPAYMLAAIQEGSRPAGDDPPVQRFQVTLARLRPVCRENTLKTATEIDATHSLLQKDGVPASELDIARP